MYSERESEMQDRANSTESWVGIPGTGTYEHTERVRGDRWKQFFPSLDGVQLTTREFDWEKDFAQVIRTMEKAAEDKRVAEATKQAEEDGKELSPIERARIARTAMEQTKKEISQDVSLFNVLKNNKDRLAVVTSTLPKQFETIQGVAGTTQTFLVQEGNRQQNSHRIFDQLRGLDRVKVDDIFHSNNITPSHTDHDFFGWTVKVGEAKYLFILNSPEEVAPEEATTEAEDELPDNVVSINKNKKPVSEPERMADAA